MTHYLSMYDSKYLHAWDLSNREWTLRIVRVEAAELTAQGGRKSKKPVIHFAGATKGLALNKTNGKAIASLYGPDTRTWVGKSVAIFPTVTDMGGETVPAIRVRPKVPATAPAETMPSVPVDEAMAEKQARAALAAEGSP